MDSKIGIFILIIALVILLWYPQYNPLSNAGSLYYEPFDTVLTAKNPNEQVIAASENQKVVDSILKNTNTVSNKTNSTDLDSVISDNSTMRSPLDAESISYDNLSQLMEEVKQVPNTPEQLLYKSKVAGKEHAADGNRKISYKDSEYRNQKETSNLDAMYTDSAIFKDTGVTTNNNFSGIMSSSDIEKYAEPNIGTFQSRAKSQKDKVLAMYDTDNHLPNKKLLNKDQTKGYQILDNPTTVSNPNLIPVLRSIPVSSIMGSNKNSSYDIRAEPPAPKMAISPFNNSSIQPNMYNANRACL